MKNIREMYRNGSESPNKQNRLYMEARPKQEWLAKAIVNGKIGPRHDSKNRSKNIF